MSKKMIILFILCFIFQGCSLLKVVSSPFQATKNSVPQSTQESKEKENCKGTAIFNEDGSIKSCSKGYSNFAQNYEQKERKLNWQERIAQFFTKTAGYLVILIIVGGILSCMGLGGLFTSFVMGATNVGVTGMKGIVQIMKAIQKTKEDNTTLIDALEKSTDEDVKLWIKEFKQKNNIT